MVEGSDTLDAVNEIDAIIMDIKLRRHEQHAQDAVDYLIAWLKERPEEVIAVARGRHVMGHLRWGDRHWGEYSEDDLVAETAEELGDAINYIVRMLWLQAQSPT